jgi:hypothetical protein
MYRPLCLVSFLFFHSSLTFLVPFFSACREEIIVFYIDMKMTGKRIQHILFHVILKIWKNIYFFGGGTGVCT